MQMTDADSPAASCMKWDTLESGVKALHVPLHEVLLNTVLTHSTKEAAQHKC